MTFVSGFTKRPVIGNSPMTVYDVPAVGTSKFGNTISWQYIPSWSSRGLTD